MTERDPMSDHDCGADTAAYVLGALDEGEAVRFRRHLDGCAVCREEVASLQSAVDALPLAAPQVTVPRGLRRRLLRAARRELRGHVVSDERSGERPFWRPPAAPARLRPALGAIVVLALGAGTFAAIESGSSPSTRVVPARVLASTGSAFLRVSDGHAELVVSRMPAPPRDRIYEVWVKRAGRPPAPTSALFNVTSAGAGAVDVPGDLRGVQEILVTPEPLGGSAVPTRAPVIDARL
jgi:anti-sigma-K factor RskA